MSDPSGVTSHRTVPTDNLPQGTHLKRYYGPGSGNGSHAAMTFKEIAAALGITPDEARADYTRGMRKIAQRSHLLRPVYEAYETEREDRGRRTNSLRFPRTAKSFFQGLVSDEPAHELREIL